MKNPLANAIAPLIFCLLLISCGGGSGSSSNSNVNPSPQALTPWTGLYDNANAIYLPYASGNISTAAVPTIYATFVDVRTAEHPFSVVKPAVLNSRKERKGSL